MKVTATTGVPHRDTSVLIVRGKQHSMTSGPKFITVFSLLSSAEHEILPDNYYQITEGTIVLFS